MLDMELGVFHTISRTLLQPEALDFSPHAALARKTLACFCRQRSCVAPVPQQRLDLDFPSSLVRISLSELISGGLVSTVDVPKKHVAEWIRNGLGMAGCNYPQAAVLHHVRSGQSRQRKVSCCLNVSDGVKLRVVAQVPR